MVLNHVEEGCIEVRGALIASDDYQNLKSELDLIRKGKQNLTIRFLQAPFVSSMVLGLIVRLAMLENVNLTIECDSWESLQFFETMGMEKNICLRLFEESVDSKHFR